VIKFLQIIALSLLTSIAGLCQQYTPNIGLQTPAPGSNAWNIPLNYNFNRLDSLLSGGITLSSLNVIGLTSWQSTTTYATGNTVLYNGLAYSSLGNGNIGNLPTNTSYWTSVVGILGSGTVTNFVFPSTLGSLFNCSVANPTTVPTVTCSIANVASATFYGNVSGSSGAPSFISFPTNASVLGTSGNGAPVSSSATTVATLFQSLTNCNTPGYTLSPQSGTCVITGTGSVVINYDLLAQTAGVGPTTIFTAPSGGTTSAKVTATCIVLPYSGTGSVNAIIQYTDNHSNVQQAISSSAAGTGQQQVSMLMNNAPSTTATVTTVVSGTIGYDIHCNGIQSAL
jgi:hypothetical protein